VRSTATLPALRLGVGIAAAACLVGLASVAIAPGETRCTAIVRASRTFALDSIAPGNVRWTTRDGSAPGPGSLQIEHTRQFDRNDAVEMVLEPALRDGAQVQAGQVLATVRSLHNRQQIQALRSEQAVLEARRALLEAGGAPEAVRAAEHELAVAEAQLAAEQVTLEKVRLLNAAGLLGTAYLETELAKDEVQRQRVDLARAGVDVARRPARESEVAALDAGIAALEASVSELVRLSEEEPVRSPIDGVLELGALDAEIRVNALDPIYLALPLPVAARGRVAADAPVLFATAGAPGRVFRGRVVAFAQSASLTQGREVLWTTAEVANGDNLLLPGMTGPATVPLDERRLGSLAELRLLIWGGHP
jgi:hypothetical protein